MPENWKNGMRKWWIIATVINPIMKTIKFLCLLKVYSSKVEKKSI